MARHPSRNELDRRTFLRGTVLGSIAVGGSPILLGCATGAGGDERSGSTPAPSGSVSADNPLGVPADGPLEVVIFNGGWGEQYAIDQEAIYQARYPDAEITHVATQETTTVLQPRFVNGTPPEVVNNSGSQSMDAATLAQNGQLAELGPLLEAPSWDIEGMTVGETLIEGTTTANSFTIDGQDGVYGIDYILNIPGLWYDAAWFADNGWTYPTTWEDFLALGAEAAAAGASLLVYQGQHPDYMVSNVFQPMLQKFAGPDAARAIDNLDPGAWESDAVRETLEALHELKTRDLIRPGTAALTHIEAQAAWLDHEALVVPCGSWLPSEMRDQTPDEFEMTVAPVPSASTSDAIPFEAVAFAAATPFLVPSDAANPAGGMEFLRIMLSREGARVFAEVNQALTVVDGVHDDQDLGPVVASSAEVLAKAREVDRLDVYRYRDWYKDLATEVDQAMGSMLTADLDPAGFVERIQSFADGIRDDDTIEKFTR